MDIDDAIEQELNKEKLEKRSRWRKSAKWLAIKGISTDDLRNGSDYIEKLKYPPWQTQPGEKPDKSEQLVGFGKHAKLTYQELKDEQPGYFQWACSEIKGFKEKANKYL
jgi:hypothetical protein